MKDLPVEPPAPLRSAGEFPLIDTIRKRTRELHTLAEQTGAVAAMLHGTLTLPGYALYLRSLLPAYRALELGLEQHRGSPGIDAIAAPCLYRSAAIEADLAALGGDTAVGASAIPRAAQQYAARVAAAASGDGVPLIAHAYVRYMGDLSGGQILKRILTRSLGLSSQALSFYEFAEIDDIAEFKAVYLTSLDSAASSPADIARVADEAEQAFKLNIDLSVAVLETVEMRRPGS